MKNQFVGFHVDFIGFSISLLCALHCAFMPILLSLIPLAGIQFLKNPWIEYSIILLSFCFASLALLSGYRKHHKRPMPLILVTLGFILISSGYFSELKWMEVLFTVTGGLAIAIGHLKNYRAKVCVHST